MSQHAKSTQDEWSQDPCLMTALPAAPAMARPAGAIPPDAPNEVAVSVVIQAAVLIEVLEAARNAKVSVAAPC